MRELRMMRTGRARRDGRGLFLFTLSFWVSAAIVAFFGLMMFLLWKREMGERYSVRGLGISPDFLQATWMDYDQYMWVDQSGTRLGVYALTLQRDDQEKIYEMAIRSRLTMKVLNTPMPIRLDGLVVLDERFVMDTFQGTLNAAGEQISLEAFTQGLELFYRVQGPPVFVPDGGIAARTVLTSPVIMADAIQPLVTQGRKLRPGEKWSTRASDPISGRLDMIVTVQVEAEEYLDMDGYSVRAFRVRESSKDVVTTSWYDREGMLLRTDLGNGLVLTRADREEAWQLYPGLKVPPNFPDIDRPAMIAQAGDRQASADQNPLAWLPRL